MTVKNTESAPPHSLGMPRLQGKMGTAALIFLVLSCAAPLASVNGLFPLTIGYAGWAGPLSFTIAALILLMFAVGLSAMSLYVPRPGAFYAYTAAGMGRSAGLGGAALAVFAYWLITTASFAYLGSATSMLVHQTFGGPEVAWYWYTLAGLAICSVLSYLNIQIAVRILIIAMIVEVAIVLIFDVLVAGQGGADSLSAASFTSETFIAGGLPVATLFAALSFVGFESTAIFREEAINPKKTIRRAMILSVVLIGVFYIFSSVMLLLAYGPERAVELATNSPDTMFIDALVQFMGPVASDIALVLLVNSVLTSLVALQNMLSRYIYSLGKDGILPDRLGAVHPRHYSPYLASIVVTAMILALAIPFMPTFIDAPMVFYGRMVGVGMYALVLLMFLASLSVVVYFYKNPKPEVHSFQSKIAPALSTIGLFLLGVLVTINFEMFSGLMGLLAWGAIIFTVLVFFLGMFLARIYKRTKPAAYQRIGRQDV